MGVDIGGYIEVRGGPHGGCCAEVPLADLFRDRDRDAFQCLFGVAGWAGFRPLAEGRGAHGVRLVVWFTR